MIRNIDTTLIFDRQHLGQRSALDQAAGLMFLHKQRGHRVTERIWDMTQETRQMFYELLSLRSLLHLHFLFDLESVMSFQLDSRYRENE